MMKEGEKSVLGLGTGKVQKRILKTESRARRCPNSSMLTITIASSAGFGALKACWPSLVTFYSPDSVFCVSQGPYVHSGVHFITNLHVMQPCLECGVPLRNLLADDVEVFGTARDSLDMMPQTRLSRLDLRNSPQTISVFANTEQAFGR